MSTSGNVKAATGPPSKLRAHLVFNNGKQHCFEKISSISPCPLPIFDRGSSSPMLQRSQSRRSNEGGISKCYSTNLVTYQLTQKSFWKNLQQSAARTENAT